jgi:putative SOS response-associated peptidase YedK
MCGRFLYRTPAAETARIFGTTNPVPNYPARYNLAPTEGVLAVRFNADDGRRYLDIVRWGLIPMWAKDRSIGNKLINARAETINELPSFRDAFAKRRCIVPADGFYEWKAGSLGKEPYVVVPTDDRPFAFAGLWERWKDQATQEIVRSCTIITTTANEKLAPLHERMPVILDRADWDKWLGDGPPTKRHDLLKMLKPFPADRVHAYRVGPRVNNVRNDDQALLEPE